MLCKLYVSFVGSVKILSVLIIIISIIYYVLCLSTHANMKEPNDRKTGQREPMPTGGNAKYDRNYEGGEYSILDIIRESSCV